MYYKEQDIDEELICACCENRYDVPKLLPCGNSFCTRCESKILNSGSSKFKCTICKGFHEKPSDEFSINIPLQKILRKTLVSVTRGEYYEKALEKIADLEGLYKKVIQNDFKSHISNECESIKNEIDVQTNILKKTIDVNRDGLLSKLKKYEDEAMDNVSVIKSDQEFQKDYSAFDNKIKEWKKILAEPTIQESDIRALLQEIVKMKNELNGYKYKMEKVLFNYKLCFYPSNLKKTVETVGSLSATKITSSSFGSIINGKYTAKLKYEFSQRVNQIRPVLFNNGRICLIISSVNTISLKLYSPECVLIEEIYLASSDGKFNAIKFNDRILLNLKDSCYSKNGFRTYSDNLHQKLTDKCNEYYDTLFGCIYADNNLIYAFSNDYQYLTTFDKDLKKVKTNSISFNKECLIHGQNSVKSGKLFNFWNSEIQIYDIYQQVLSHSIKLNKNYNNNNFFLQLISNDTFCVIDRGNRDFKVFDFELNCLTHFEIEDVNYITYCSFTDDGRLFVIDDDTKTLIFV